MELPEMQNAVMLIGLRVSAREEQSDESSTWLHAHTNTSTLL